MCVQKIKYCLKLSSSSWSGGAKKACRHPLVEGKKIKRFSGGTRKYRKVSELRGWQRQSGIEMKKVERRHTAKKFLFLKTWNVIKMTKKDQMLNNTNHLQLWINIKLHIIITDETWNYYFWIFFSHIRRLWKTDLTQLNLCSIFSQLCSNFSFML